MKTSFAVIASAVLFACAPAFAQSAAPVPSADPQVVAATKQMLDSMNLHDTLAATMQQLEQQIPAQMRASATAAINGNPKLDAKQKAAALAKLDEEVPKASATMHALLSDPTLIDDMIAQMVPMYAETYTLDEIRQLTAFYNSPVGKKTLAVTPTLMGRSMAAANGLMMPRVQKAMAQAAQANATQ